MNKQVEELREFGGLDGSEWGEMALSLCSLYGFRDYLNEKFVNELEGEILSQLEAVKENAQVVETIETFSRTVKSLEWN